MHAGAYYTWRRRQLLDVAEHLNELLILAHVETLGNAHSRSSATCVRVNLWDLGTTADEHEMTGDEQPDCHTPSSHLYTAAKQQG